MSAYDKDDDKFFDLIKGLMAMPETSAKKELVKTLQTHQEIKLEKIKLERIKLTLSQGREAKSNNMLWYFCFYHF